MNFDGPEAAEVRRFYLANAAYWIEEFHFDGMRFDATQAIHDSSQEHILAALARQVRVSAGNRATLLVAENEPQHTRLVRAADQGGFGLDALWNDDFHHTAQVALTGHSEAYYSGLSRHAPGIHFRGQVRISLPGPMVPLAEQAARHASARSASGRLCELHSKPRPGGKLHPRRTLPCLEQPGMLSGNHGPFAAGAGNTDALPGSGIRFFAAVPSTSPI